jgi:hypothetical protein
MNDRRIKAALRGHLNQAAASRPGRSLFLQRPFPVPRGVFPVTDNREILSKMLIYLGNSCNKPTLKGEKVILPCSFAVIGR